MSEYDKLRAAAAIAIMAAHVNHNPFHDSEKQADMAVKAADELLKRLGYKP